MPEIHYSHLFSYRPLPDFREKPGYPNYFPAIPVRLVNRQDRAREKDVVAVLDSGAYVSVFDGEIASELGLNLCQGRPDSLNTASGETVRVWLHQIYIKLEGAADVLEIESEVAFTEARFSRNLLGRRDFFQALQIGFNEGAGEIYLEPM